MKKIFIIIVSAFLCIKIQAQLTIQNGTWLQTTGNAIISLQNMDIQNAGAIQQESSGKFLFTGTANNTIATLGNNGYSEPVFATIEIAKTSTGKLILGQVINANDGVKFTSGNIDLGGYILRLNGTGLLMGENETSRITGVAGGFVQSLGANVTNASLLNQGSLGAVITANNLGNLEIRRSHIPAVNPYNGLFTGIQRSFIIIPQNNTALNATLRFYYLNAELNGKDPNTLTLWKSTDGINWSLAGVDSRDALNKYVEKTGITDFSIWTLSDASNPLPISLLSFQAICKDDYALLQWQTASELNAASIVVEKSIDGNIWTDIQTIAATNNATGSTYTYNDMNPLPIAYYRLKMVDKDGTYTYSPVFSGSCSEAAMPLAIYPNPAHNTATVRFSVRKATKASIAVYSLSGQMIAQHNWDLQVGVNSYALNEIAGLAAGTYIIKVNFNNTSVEGKLIKQ